MTELSVPTLRGDYVSGFTSLDAEIDVEDLPVRGTIPDWSINVVPMNETTIAV